MRLNSAIFKKCNGVVVMTYAICGCMLYACDYHSAQAESPPAHNTTMPNDSAAQGEQTLKDAIKKNDLAAVKAIVGSTTKKEINDAMQGAAYYGNIPAMKILLKHGADVNYMAGMYSTLTFAVRLDKVDAVKFLIQHGAKVEPPPKTLALSPLEVACQDGALASAKILLEAGADPNKIPYGDSLLPIDYAANYGYSDIVKELLKHGANANFIDKASGMTPIGFAITGEHWDTVQVLVEGGADPNIPDTGGWTPLHAAAQAHNVEMVRFLVKHGAKTDARSKVGLTPADMAKKKNPDDKKVQEILKILSDKK